MPARAKLVDPLLSLCCSEAAPILPGRARLQEALGVGAQVLARQLALRARHVASCSRVLSASSSIARRAPLAFERRARTQREPLLVVFDTCDALSRSRCVSAEGCCKAASKSTSHSKTRECRSGARAHVGQCLQERSRHRPQIALARSTQPPRAAAQLRGEGRSLCCVCARQSAAPPWTC